jgi:glycosyltransferase involved in cell wall biosynthesis
MTTDAVGGVWTYALDLAAALGPLGWKTTLAVLGPAPTPAARRAAAATPGLTLVETGLPLEWMARDPRQVDAAAAAVGRLAAKVEPDLIHLNSPTLAAVAGFATPVVGVCHSCVATWWQAVRTGGLPDDFQWRTRALWRGLMACDALVAPTAAFADAVARTYEVPAPFVVWNGRSAAAAPASVSRAPLVFTSGRLWDDGKNVAALDAAAPRISAPVCAAGPLEGPNGAAVLPRNLRPLGALAPEDVRTWLAKAPVFCSPALYEPFGLGVLEAAQAGCALVLADIPTFRELWDGAAVFVDPHSPDAIAAACNRLLADPAAAAARGEAARLHARRFSPARMAAGIAEVYACALAATAPARREAAA